MYVPPVNAVHDEDELRRMVAAAATAWLVSAAPAGPPLATLLPIMWQGALVRAHLARANPQWRNLDGAQVLLVCPGPDTYVSPSWYATKAEHGRVVPTWNYTAVHLTGTARVLHDPDELRALVTDLTDVHEQGRVPRWQVSDAPSAYVDGQLRGIVGVEVAVTGVEGKAKLSQNRSAADRAGVVEGLRGEPGRGAAAVAAGMDALDAARAVP